MQTVFTFLLPLLSFVQGGLHKRAVGQQNPGVWDALIQLRGKDALTNEEIMMLFTAASGDFPVLSDIPETSFKCENVNQPGFYADIETKCQVIRRCDTNNQLWSYLCPNMTLFNQITLVCDWWYNIDCERAKDFYNYSNSRLYIEGSVLLDNAEMTVHVIEHSEPKSPVKALRKKSKKSKQKGSFIE